MGGNATMPATPDTEQLLDLAAGGDRDARDRLLARYRRRLRDLVALRLDRRLAARVDPSDVVQDSLLAADARLADYLRQRRVPFYVWLRGLALDRLADLHRRHVRAKRRSVRREEAPVELLPDESLQQLAGRLADRGSSPSAGLRRADARDQAHAALARLEGRDREVLVLRHLEQLSTREIASVLGVTEGAVKVGHVRALQRLRGLLGAAGEEQS
jgi:RNA polymerase sigma-70 factor (ECF subfamily)